MTTTVTSSIGTSGRTYSTIQAWEDACPANLVTDDKIWRGECYNDSEFVASNFTNVVVISGMTTDATRYVELTAAAGQAFCDHASIRTLPLLYDATKGVALRTGSAAPIYIGASYTRISRLQTKLTSSAHFVGGAIDIVSGSTGVQIDQCTIKGEYYPIYRIDTTNCKTTRCLIIGNSNEGTQVREFGNEFHHCTIVQIGGMGNGVVGTVHFNLNTKLYNCAVFGWAAIGAVDDIDVFEYCASNLSAPGFASETGSQFGLTYVNQFENVSSHASADWRVKSGANLIGAGNGSVSGSPTHDITGTAYASPPTIGCWEFTVGGPPLTVIVAN